MSPRNLLILCEHDASGYCRATSHIRLLLPFRHPAFGSAYRVSDASALPEEDFHVVVLERYWHDGITLTEAERVVRVIRRRSRLFLYSLDDNLVDLKTIREESGDEDTACMAGVERRAAVRHFLRNADAVLVSTRLLADRVRQWNRKTLVLPNALDERLFPDIAEQLERLANTDETSVPVRFGYMGTGTHTGDLRMILDPLRRFLRSHPGRVKFQIAGVTTDESLRRELSELSVKFLDVQQAASYPGFVRWATKALRWDFAIAPLAPTALNICKSDIKYLDYSLLGIPAIFSDTAAYRDTVRHKETGILCPNDASSWTAAFEEMLAGVRERRMMAWRAYRDVRQNRTLAHCAANWRRAVDQCHGGFPAQP